MLCRPEHDKEERAPLAWNYMVADVLGKFDRRTDGVAVDWLPQGTKRDAIGVWADNFWLVWSKMEKGA